MTDGEAIQYNAGHERRGLAASATNTNAGKESMESAPASAEPVLNVDIRDWRPELSSESSKRLAMALEQGKVLCLADLPFALSEQECVFLSPAWLSGKRKNISLDGEHVRGSNADPGATALLGAMIKRYSVHATGLVTRMFPGYQNKLKGARTSFRPGMVDEAPASWRKDDSRLHVDAFPSRP
ncbi:MAG: Kdo hydroxylase family protein, partial [Betaproteobacteria bacterium]